MIESNWDNKQTPDSIIEDINRAVKKIRENNNLRDEKKIVMTPNELKWYKKVMKKLLNNNIN